MRPILISTPRTGSTIICQKIFNLSKINFNYIDNLNEFFSINDIVKKDYYLENSIIKQTQSQRVYSKWAENKKKIQLNRLEMLKVNPNYMIKLFTINLEPSVEKFIVENYDLIYLERTNKIHQFLSYLGLFSEHKRAHNMYNDPYVISSLHYDPILLRDFLKIYDSYKRFKSTYPGQTLYYEDIEAEISEEIIARKLNWQNIRVINQKSAIIKTEYSNSYELMLDNYDEWIKDKHLLLAD